MTTKMTNESLETQASIMLKNAEDRLMASESFDRDDYDAALILNRLSCEVYFGGEWTFGEPLY